MLAPISQENALERLLEDLAQEIELKYRRVSLEELETMGA